MSSKFGSFSLKSAVLFLLIISCSPSGKKVNNIESKKDSATTSPISNIESGKISDKVFCSNSSIINYALYIPKNYSVDKKWPVIFLFDPHAKGKLPVKNYAELAEKYGYILCGSNNSKNGMDVNSAQAIAAETMKDIVLKYSINSKRIYLGGFSGGARVAATIAMQNNIAGMIGCGAGLPPNAQFMNKEMIYIGLAGKEDFNYVEMRFIKEESHSFPAGKAQLLVFDGKHEWPSSEIMEEAFVWISSDSLRKEAESMLPAKFDKEQLVKEFNLQQKYMKAIPTEEIKWWQREISTMKLLSDKKGEDAYMYKRLLNYLSLGTYMYSQSAIAQNGIASAENFLTLYEMVDPANSEHAYMWAVIAIQKGDKEQTISFLKKAVQLGFEDKERLAADNAFASIKNEEEFQSIIDSIKE